MSLDNAPNNDLPAPVTQDFRGRVVEIFSSIQGEGLWVGQRHIFVRMAGCPWRCRYCDTPLGLTSEPHPVMTLDQVLDAVFKLNQQRSHEAVSLTGGEPLVQSEFLKVLLPRLKDLGLKTYLETSATHPRLFESLMENCDIVAADIKLPSEIGRSLWAEQEEFLRLAGEKAFVKIVLTDRTTDEEFETAVHLLLRLAATPTLVLQPVTPVENVERRLGSADAAPGRVLPPGPSRLIGFWDWARQRLPAVKLIPQMHPLWGMP